MYEETITINYSEMISLPKVEDTREYGFNSRAIVSYYDENIIPSVKMKKLDQNIYRSIRMKKSKLIKEYEQDNYKIRSLEF